jgi:hypothetical protein
MKSEVLGMQTELHVTESVNKTILKYNSNWQSYVITVPEE